MWLRQTETGLRLVLHIQSGSKNTEITGLHGDALKIRLHAVRQKGEANQELLRFLSERLGIPHSQIQILQGELNKKKLLSLKGLSLEDARLKLGGYSLP